MSPAFSRWFARHVRVGPTRAACCAFAVLSLAGCKPPTDEGSTRSSRLPQPVEVATVGRRDLRETLQLVGTIEARESAQIHPEAAGIVERIYFREGQPVSAGDVLLKIDDRELVAKSLTARASFQLAEQTLRRVSTLHEAQTLPETEYDQAIADFERAHAELELVRTLLGKTEVKAPFDGIVGARTISPGDYVTTQTTITSVDDLSQLRVTFDVPQRHVGKIGVGTTFAVRWGGQPCAANSGDVYFVNSTIDRNTRASQVRGLLEQSPPSLKPGMFVDVDLVLDVHEQVLTVPEGAIFTSIAGPQIVIARAVNDGFEAAFVPVELGLRSDGVVEIAPSEPVENEPVVAAGVGALTLYPGTPLKPRPAIGIYRSIEQY